MTAISGGKLWSGFAAGSLSSIAASAWSGGSSFDADGSAIANSGMREVLGWSDVVFKKEYNLPALEEVEKHIAEKGHLENIPSETEVLQNGINLGEMNAKLLQKIEEMTLYRIEQNKQIMDLKNRLEKVEAISK